MPDNPLAAFLRSERKTLLHGRSVQKTRRQHYSIQLPRRIHMFWDQGFEAAPDIVQLCVRSWRACNPDWDIILLDQDDADKIISRDLFPKEMKVAHYADVLRTALLAEGGGIWVDASCLCLKPLDHWLPNMFNQCEFFAFHRPAQDRMISSWFLGAAQDSVIAAEMYAIALEYWNWGPYENGEPPYFWFHYLFEYLANNHQDVKAQWSHMPKVSAVPVHQLKRRMSETVADSDQLRDRIKATPVQKLTHKQGIEAGNVLRFLKEINITL